MRVTWMPLGYERPLTGEVFKEYNTGYEVTVEGSYPPDRVFWVRKAEPTLVVAP